MLKYLVGGGILFAFTISLIVWATRPDMLETAAKEIKKPLTDWQATREEATWLAAKEGERNLWMRKLNLPDKCESPKTEVRKLECKNLVDLHAQTFEKMWRRKVADGWKPDGV